MVGRRSHGPGSFWNSSQFITEGRLPESISISVARSLIDKEILYRAWVITFYCFKLTYWIDIIAVRLDSAFRNLFYGSGILIWARLFYFSFGIHWWHGPVLYNKHNSGFWRYSWLWYDSFVHIFGTVELTLNWLPNWTRRSIAMDGLLCWFLARFWFVESPGYFRTALTALTDIWVACDVFGRSSTVPSWAFSIDNAISSVFFRVISSSPKRRFKISGERKPLIKASRNISFEWSALYLQLLASFLNSDRKVLIDSPSCCERFKNCLPTTDKSQRRWTIIQKCKNEKQNSLFTKSVGKSITLVGLFRFGFCLGWIEVVRVEDPFPDLEYTDPYTDLSGIPAKGV